MERRRIIDVRKTGSMGRLSQLLIAGSLVLLGLAFYLFYTQLGKKTNDAGELTLPVSAHDFGSVSIDQGTVTVELPLVNTGDGDLTISFIESSCGCVSARVINDGRESPVFGKPTPEVMASSLDWHTVISPGRQAVLKINYDPAKRPDFRGTAVRRVTIISNAKAKPVKQVKIKVNQVD